MKPTPLALICELTHRCPLHCVYCSNPLELQARKDELDKSNWIRVFDEAAALGVVQLHFTGGEPLARADILDLVKGAHSAKLYTNLITSGVGLTEEKLKSLVDAGLDHVQLSFQDSRPESANEIAGTKAHDHKIKTGRLIAAEKVGFTVNMVIHRQNIARLGEMIAMAEDLGATKMEIAHVQYYGWAFKNRGHLMPTRVQVDESVKIVNEAKKRLKGQIRMDFVVPDYYAKFPKPCMGGWGRQIMLVNPVGDVFPCHASGQIPGLHFDSVLKKSLDWIWKSSAAFQRFRGEEWMPEPCRSCDKRSKDFGGCRCQAFLLTGDASATDPVCSLAPKHGDVQKIVDDINSEKHSQNFPPTWIHRGES